ncbi:hypothetical protein R1A27_06470 [Methylobacterium sp. NMS12]|uniref:hypothetical protein n=1 Tax=Methylobacterium sp. NMS12 TaxID=3079766 RepID=UPI003F885C9B
MVFTRGNFNPQEMLNFAQQAKSSLQGYNERFLTGIMPSIVSTMGGDRAGTAANSFNGVIDGKVNDKKQAEEWLRLGLLDKSQAIMKAGHAMGWRTGAIKNTALAHADPLQWMEDVVLPALREKGGRDGKGIDVDDKEALKQALATLFRNQNANFFANELSQKNMRSRLHKDEHLMTQVGSMDDIYKRNLASDPIVALTGLKASLENLLSTATGPGMPLAASSITGLATAIQAVSNAASDHPVLATMAGGAAAAGALAGAGALSYGIMNGFGLGASAVALDGAAAALTSAAVAQGGTAVAGAGGAAAAAAAGAAGAKASRWGRAGKFVKGAAGVAGVGILAELAQQQNVLTAPDVTDGLKRAAVAALDPTLADLMFGESSAVGRGRRANAAGRRMAGIRASALPTEIGSGRLGFGINGPVGALDAVPSGTGGGAPQSGFGASPVDAGKIEEAKSALAGYRAELATLKTDMAATAGLDLPGLGEGMERRKAELEGLVASMEAKLQTLGAVTVSPTVDTGSISAASSMVDTLLGKLSQVGPAAAGVQAQIAGVRAPSGGRAANRGWGGGVDYTP